MSKFAVILGAQGGIGRPITHVLLEAGYTVLGTELVDEIRNSLSDRGGQYIPYQLDLCNQAGVETFIAASTARGAIDILVNAAGFIDENESSLGTPSETISKTLAVNIGSVARITEAFLPHLAPGAKIIHISSTAGLWGNPGFPVYSASKAALNLFCRSIAKHLLSTKNSIYCICPGPTNTGLRERIAHDASKHQDPACVAETVRNIVADTSPYSNGDIIIVRGGEEFLHQSLD